MANHDKDSTGKQTADRVGKVDLGLKHLNAKYDPNAALMFEPGDFRGDANDKFSFNSIVRLREEIREFGLEQNIIDLDLLGYTVVEPDKVASFDFRNRLKNTVLDVARRKSGVPVDAESGFANRAAVDTVGTFEGGEATNNLGWFLAHRVLFEDPIFEEAVMNPIALTLASYLVGYQCVLATSILWLKQGPTAQEVIDEWDGSMHADSWSPEPFPNFAQQANCTWALSDYSRDNGGLLFVPGSHKLLRRPDGSLREGRDQLVPIECPAGSLIVFGDAVWHGIIPRKNPGIRLTLINAYKRSYLQTEEAYRNMATPEMIARNPPRFKTLMGDWLDYSVDSNRAGNPAAGVGSFRRF